LKTEISKEKQAALKRLALLTQDLSILMQGAIDDMVALEKLNRLLDRIHSAIHDPLKREAPSGPKPPSTGRFQSL